MYINFVQAGVNDGIKERRQDTRVAPVRLEGLGFRVESLG